MKLVYRTHLRIGFISCAIIFSSMNYVQADSFGRLFTTSKQRDILDDIRRHPKQTKLTKTPASSVKNKRITGVVIRDDGKNTLWVNGKVDLNKLDIPRSDAAVERVINDIFNHHVLD